MSRLAGLGFVLIRLRLVSGSVPAAVIADGGDRYGATGSRARTFMPPPARNLWPRTTTNRSNSSETRTCFGTGPWPRRVWKS